MQEILGIALILQQALGNAEHLRRMTVVQNRQSRTVPLLHGFHKFVIGIHVHDPNGFRMTISQVPRPLYCIMYPGNWTAN